MALPLTFSTLTNDELVRAAHAEPGLTGLERELLSRLERAMRRLDDIDPPTAVDFSRQMSLDFS